MATERQSARWLLRLARQRSAPVAFGLLALLLTLPALGVGLIGDDYFHRMVLLGIPDGGFESPPLRYLFSFIPEGRQGYMMDRGYLPWWCDPGIHIAFSRPLTALTHAADYALWPDRFGLQHLHSLGWLLAGVALVAILYRKVHGATLTAAVAAGFFAIEDAHAVPAGWLANRNALICLVAGTAVILLHLAWHSAHRAGACCWRFRRSAWRWAAEKPPSALSPTSRRGSSPRSARPGCAGSRRSCRTAWSSWPGAPSTSTRVTALVDRACTSTPVDSRCDFSRPSASAGRSWFWANGCSPHRSVAGPAARGPAHARPRWRRPRPPSWWRCCGPAADRAPGAFLGLSAWGCP